MRDVSVKQRAFIRLTVLRERDFELLFFDLFLSYLEVERRI